MPGAVEEIVRHASPVIHFRRTVTQDGAGLVTRSSTRATRWCCSTAPAARLMPSSTTRTHSTSPATTNHIGFGGPGPHFCLGAHLARRQINVLYKLLSQVPDIHAVGEPNRLRSSFINGVKHLSGLVGAPLDALRSSRAAPSSSSRRFGPTDGKWTDASACRPHRRSRQ